MLWSSQFWVLICTSGKLKAQIISYGSLFFTIYCFQMITRKWMFWHFVETVNYLQFEEQWDILCICGHTFYDSMTQWISKHCGHSDFNYMLMCQISTSQVVTSNAHQWHGTCQAFALKWYISLGTDNDLRFINPKDKHKIHILSMVLH